MTVLAALLDVVQIAHETDFFHEEPVRSSGGGGASVIVIVVGILVSLLAVGGLIWLKRRMDA
ncbi:MAG TPA: hypothetical protein VG106_11300 [Vicinamibacterales bacterium]|nr:hypothetical protein [Vicinamibacterales bacterium]